MIPVMIERLPVSHIDITVLNDILTQEKAARVPGMEDDEFFSSQQVLRDFQVDPEEITSGLVSQSANDIKGSDGGIDAMYIFYNGRLLRDMEQAEALKSAKQNIILDVIIIQASRQSGFDLNRILRIKDASENIFGVDRDTNQFSEKYNEPLLDSINRFRAVHRAIITKKAEIQVSYFYVTNGDSTKLSPDVDAKARELEKAIPKTLATVKSCTFTFVGARDLIDLYCQGRSKTRAC